VQGHAPAGYAVLEAMSPADAEGFARVHKGTIHLLVADLATPRVRGREFVRSMQTIPARIENRSSFRVRATDRWLSVGFLRAGPVSCTNPSRPKSWPTPSAARLRARTSHRPQTHSQLASRFRDRRSPVLAPPNRTLPLL